MFVSRYRSELREVLGSSGRVSKTASSFALNVLMCCLVGTGMTSGVFRLFGSALYSIGPV